MDWTDANQLGRRNLKPDQFTNLLGRRVDRAERKQGERNDLTSSQIATKSKTDTVGDIAKAHGVDRATAYRAAEKFRAIEKLAETQPEQAQLVVNVVHDSHPPHVQLLSGLRLLPQLFAEATAARPASERASAVAGSATFC